MAVKGGRCAEHQRAVYREQNAARPSASAQGYGSEWRKTRAAYLREHPECEWPQGCGAEATEVHHLLAKKQGGTDEDANLLALCKTHHSRITALSGQRWGKR